MDIFPLPLFPQGSLASSVITTVWVGVVILAYFNLRLGWVFSGLVVPGYIIPLLLVKPWAAWVVFAEALLTYILVWIFAEYMSRWGYWSTFFGRDRFLALVLTGVLVRIVSDGWLLPLLGEWLNTSLGMQFDYRNNLHSFGLIIIALVANQFWKTGIARSLPPMIVTCGLTYLAVRYGLMELTNFTISSLGYLYEDIAISILASPKSYIILITTAFLASRMNLRYGWDFNGILVPSLLALQWYQPTKILTSFGEAFLILIVASFLLNTPIFQRTTVEGARKTLLFFNISFAYKMLLGHLLLRYFPYVKVTDFYGFGYLLPTLLAMKMHDKGIVLRLTRATIQISLMGVAVACSIGFSLTLLPSLWPWAIPTPVTPITADQVLLETRLMDVLRNDKVALYQNRKPESFVVPVSQEITAFTDAVRYLKTYMMQREPQHLQQARGLLTQVNYRLDDVQGRYLYLRERPPQRGWGMYVLDLQTPNGLLVEVPTPLDEWKILEAGVWLFNAMPGSALAIAGTQRRSNADGAADVTRNQQTFFHVFHKEMARRNAVQVRGYTTESVRLLSGARRGQADIEVPQLPSTLWVKAALPRGLDLVQLQEAVGDYVTTWDTSPLPNVQRDVTRAGFAELILSREARRKLLVRSFLQHDKVELQVHNQRIDGYLQDWLLRGKGLIASKGTDLYQPPAQEELLFFDQEVLTPLLSLLRTAGAAGRWATTEEEELRTMAASAALLGYRLIQYHHKASGRHYLLLAEQDGVSERRYWGTYVWRIGPATPYVIEVPRPLSETNSFEYGVALFERLAAQALLIGGAHARANVDGNADLLQDTNKANVFNLVNQVMLRDWGVGPLMTIQSRAFSHRPDRPTPDADVLVAFRGGRNERQALSSLGRKLVQVLEQDGLAVRFVDGTPETAGYEVGRLPQARYLDATVNKEFAVLWLSPLTRTQYRQQTDNRWQETQFAVLDIPTVEADLYQYITDKRLWEDSSQLPTQLREKLQHYIETRDIVRLQAIRLDWPRYRFERLLDLDSKQAFLLVYRQGGRLALVANLSPRSFVQAVRMSPAQAKRKPVQRFVDTRALWLELEETP